MKTYTVLLLCPDYVADEFGKDTYMAHVDATSVENAEDAARLEAKNADAHAGQCPTEIDPDDYAILMVIEGKHMDIKTS